TKTTPSGPLRLIYPNNDDNLTDLNSRGRHLPDAKTTGPYTIVINLDGQTTYPLDGRSGVTYITLGNIRAQYQLKTPDDGGLSEASRVRSPDRKPGWQHLGQPDAMTVAQATTFARRLAQWSITGPQPSSGPRAAAPKDTSWLSLVGAKTVEDLTPDRWQEYSEGTLDGAIAPDLNRLRFPIGHDTATGEVVALDIKEGAEGGFGPHGMLIGTTGSGKSEFLRTMLCSACATHHPNQLNMMLVDWKGGTTYQGMENQPHVVGIITDMEEEADLTERFVVTMQGEINRRKILQREAARKLGVAIGDFRVYEQHRQAGADIPPVPALFVVIDEFANLMAKHPEFVDPFVEISIAGRSLRIHLLLATQAITTQVSNQIAKLEVNLDYRIAMRTATPGESKAVIGNPEAHYIKKGEEGEGYLRTVPDEDPIRFRAAYTGGTYNPHKPPTAATPAVSTTADDATPTPTWEPTVELFTTANATRDDR
ncbi:FtsK/SpoIIIE domain-containing protein, partial [Mycobacterium talmoniae]|uniref:FtsK/SpoIIIE domain-containing protein n=1 Tax=Mycobacterium talmoniae TaxID=1858794 RepID=UPI000A479DEE